MTVTINIPDQEAAAPTAETVNVFLVARDRDQRTDGYGPYVGHPMVRCFSLQLD